MAFDQEFSTLNIHHMHQMFTDEAVHQLAGGYLITLNENRLLYFIMVLTTSS